MSALSILAFMLGFYFGVLAMCLLAIAKDRP